MDRVSLEQAKEIIKTVRNEVFNEGSGEPNALQIHRKLCNIIWEINQLLTPIDKE